MSENDACLSLRRCCKPHTSPCRRQRIPLPITHLDHRDLSLLVVPPEPPCKRPQWQSGHSRFRPARRPVSMSSPALAGGRPGRTLIRAWLDPHGPGTAGRTAALLGRAPVSGPCHGSTGKASRSQSKCVARRLFGWETPSRAFVLYLHAGPAGPARDEGLIQTRFVAPGGLRHAQTALPPNWVPTQPGHRSRNDPPSRYHR